MGTTARYFLYGIRLPSGAWITDLTDLTPAANVELIEHLAAGAVDPHFRAASGAKPKITFSTPQIKTILGLCGLGMADLSAGNCDLYYRAAVNRGTRAAIGATSHLRIRAIACALWWTRLAPSQGQIATITCTLQPTFDGNNPPLLPAGSVAIPNDAAFNADFYSLGPVSVNGSAVGGIAGWSLDTGMKVAEETSDGEDCPRWVGMDSRSLALSFTPRSLATWESLGLAGGAVTAAAFALRKRQANSAYAYADSQAVHILFSGAGNPCGYLTVENTSGGIQDAATQNLKLGFSLATIGTDCPVTVSTAAALT